MFHPRQAGGGHVLFLPFQGDLPTCLCGHFQQQRSRAAGGVVGGGGGPGVGVRDADDLGDDAADFGRCVELALALARVLGEVAHQVFVGIAEQVVVVGAVVGEVQLGLFEDGDQVAQALDHGRAFAKLVGVVEVGEVTARQLGVGVDQLLDDLRVDPVADVGLALERHHVLEGCARRNDHRRGKVVAVTVLVADVLDEQHEQHVVLVLAGVHAAAQFVARGPDGTVEVGFLDDAVALRGNSAFGRTCFHFCFLVWRGYFTNRQRVDDPLFHCSDSLEYGDRATASAAGDNPALGKQLLLDAVIGGFWPA